jgi:pimeloyl-ACP methyl ester carboxylesterase
VGTDLYSMTNAVIDAARAVGPVDLPVAHSLGAIAATRAVDHGLETKRLVLVAPGVFPRHAFDRFVSDLGLSDRVAGHVEAAMNERFGVGVFDQVGQEMLDARPPSGSRIVRGSADELVPWNDVESLAESWEMPVDVIEAATHNSVLGDPEAIRIVLDAATTMDSTPSDRMDVRLEASR